MKRLVYSALAIFCLAVVSCTNEVPVPDYGEDHIVLNVFNSPMTMAEGATDYERELNRLDCFFYVKDKTNEPCVYYHKAEVNDLGGATIRFYVNDLVLKEIFPSGSLCDVFVIANIPGNPTFEAKDEGTSMEDLGKYVLDMTAEKYDGIGKPFVMTGFSTVQKSKNSSATANIALKRVASKVTMTVKVPKSIEVGSDKNKVKMLPVLADRDGKVPLKTSFRYGTSKGYLSGVYPDESDNYIMTDKVSYTLLETTTTHYVFKCDVPFYTYSREWAKGSGHAAYVTFEMPWGKDEDDNGKADQYNTYYYQILVNGKERNFVPNTHYDMTVTVGVLGSTVESLPKELAELSYYVLDWTTETSNGNYGSGDRQENVQIDKYNYLEVPQTLVEMDNDSEVAIRYNASHKIGWELREFTNDEEGETVEGLPSATKLSALYIDNGSGTPTAKDISDTVLTLKDVFKDDNKGSLTFKCDLSELQKTLGLTYPIYSPVYVFITIWLDVNGNGEHDADEKLEQDVKIVIYPAIYIVGDKSTLYSVFVNGTYRQTASKSDYTYINKKQVGKAVGTDGDDPMMYMNIISISAFSKDNTFVYSDGKEKQYIIGDPRERTPNKLGVGDDTEEVKKNADGWIKATDVTGKVRNLEHYYPTSTEANSYQVIAPKFRIASKLGGYSECDADGAALRCASYQEDGFPAGRWRLPTTAEVLFIVELQKQSKIKALFYGGNTYSSATDKIKVNNNNYEWNNAMTKPSVRCVYDDWFWGSEREAIEDPNKVAGDHKFTWGDEKIY
jgi:hypothetical protein